MTHVAEDLDRELKYLSRLAQGYPHDSSIWEAVWERIDRLLDERGGIIDEHNSSL